MLTLGPTAPCRSPSQGSFRDPQGTLYQDGDRILREVRPRYVAPVLTWLRSPLAQRWVQEHRMVSTVVLASEDGQPMLLEHEHLFFPSYPWEWAPSQWFHAAAMTLDLCEEAPDSGFILKDASPLNILFRGTRPVFVDVLSGEHRDPHCPIWMAYGQFARSFLLPLCAYVYLGWPLAATMQRRDGYEPADLAPHLPMVRRWRRPLRSLVTVPLLFEKMLHNKAGPPRLSLSKDASTYALRRVLRSTRKLLASLVPSPGSSRWDHYPETACHYKPLDHAAKQACVRRWLDRIRPARVLDVGANTGTYSRIAAESGADVVAWDTDVAATDLNWQAAHRASLSILPLVADFARPTPAVGWRNRESAGLLVRARGRFDCVLMLAILHHLLIADQIPLAAILDQLCEISACWVVIEWVPTEDPQFDELCRGRQELYRHLSESYFVEALSGRFAVRDREQLPNGRTLWLLQVVA